jgi:hypothetical protein
MRRLASVVSWPLREPPPAEPLVVPSVKPTEKRALAVKLPEEVRATLHRMSAFGVSPRPCETLCCTGAVPVDLLKLPTLMLAPWAAAGPRTAENISATAHGHPIPCLMVR